MSATVPRSTLTIEGSNNKEVGSRSLASKLLKASAGLWFLTTVTGQWIFMLYVAIAYGRPAISGDIESVNNVSPSSYIPGDTLGNIALAAHLILAVIIMFGGPLQLVPQVRKYAPKFHHWNGRIYILTVIVTSLAGLYMVWTRGTVGGMAQHLGVSLNAVLIIVFAILAVRHAIARRLNTHRRWALRLFIVVSGVWFYRVGLMFWLTVHGGPVGFNPKTFEGPFISFIAFANYLLPLAILEIYLQVRDRKGTASTFVMAGGLLIVTLAMGAGIFAAAMGMWLPRILE